MLGESEIGDEQIQLDVDKIYILQNHHLDTPHLTGGDLALECTMVAENTYVDLNIRTPSAYFGMKPTKAL